MVKKTGKMIQSRDGKVGPFQFRSNVAVLNLIPDILTRLLFFGPVVCFCFFKEMVYSVCFGETLLYSFSNFSQVVSLFQYLCLLVML